MDKMEPLILIGIKKLDRASSWVWSYENMNTVFVFNHNGYYSSVTNGFTCYTILKIKRVRSGAEGILFKVDKNIIGADYTSQTLIDFD